MKSIVRFGFLCLVTCATSDAAAEKSRLATLAPHAAPLVAALAPIPTNAFCVTSGRVEPTGPRSQKVTAAGMRGVAAADASRKAEVAFTYRGPSRNDVPLANGEVRRQIGLKLRAQDTCNVV